MTDDFPTAHWPARRATMPVLTIAAVAAAFALGFWLLNSMRALESREHAHSDEVGERLAEMARRTESLAGDDRQVASSLADLTQRVDDLAGARRAGLLATEAEHLVRLAAQRLTLMQDPQGALALLLAADAALQSVRTADTHAARSALAQDIARLRDMATLDVEATWLRLAALSTAFDGLVQPRTTANAATGAPAGNDRTATTGTGWERFRNSLMSLVTLRRVDEPLSPLVTTGEREFAAQNFRLLVEQAQLALLQRRAGVYGAALQQADRWLARTTGGDPLQRTRLQREIASLQTLDIGRNAPDLTTSLAATRTLAARLLPETDAVERAP
ncbi:MAG: uroporphyrinogen-III C-methyltransferase [Pseudomonadota bacterium]